MLAYIQIAKLSTGLLPQLRRPAHTWEVYWVVGCGALWVATSVANRSTGLLPQLRRPAQTWEVYLGGRLLGIENDKECCTPFDKVAAASGKTRLHMGSVLGGRLLGSVNDKECCPPVLEHMDYSIVC